MYCAKIKIPYFLCLATYLNFSKNVRTLWRYWYHPSTNKIEPWHHSCWFICKIIKHDIFSPTTHRCLSTLFLKLNSIYHNCMTMHLIKSGEKCIYTVKYTYKYDIFNQITTFVSYVEDITSTINPSATNWENFDRVLEMSMNGHMMACTFQDASKLNNQ